MTIHIFQYCIPREPLGSSGMRLKNIEQGVVFIAYHGEQSLVSIFICFYCIKHVKQTKKMEHFVVIPPWYTNVTMATLVYYV